MSIRKIEDILENYILITSLFFLIEHGYIENLLSPEGLQGVEHEIWETLIHLGVVENTDDTYFFTSSYKKILSGNGINKLYIVLGYKDFFEKLGQDPSFERKKNHQYIALGSSNVIKNLNKAWIESAIQNKKISSIVDFGSGNSQMIIELAKLFPQVTFYGVEIDSKACLEAQQCIQDTGLKNIEIICKNILEITIDDIPKVDMFFASFVIHEFIASGDIQKFFEILRNIQPQYITFREFCPPQDFSVLEGKTIDTFFHTYHFIHNISGQSTYTVKQWENLFAIEGYRNICTDHLDTYNLGESMYPVLLYEKV